MKTICVIPARAGSKSIPNKNNVEIGGMPLFMHSVIQACNASNIDLIVVSSNDEKVKQTLSCVPQVVYHSRPEEICGDKSPTEETLIDVVNNFPGYDSVVLLQPTSPIRFKGRVEECINKYNSGDYDSLLTATKFYNFFFFESLETSGYRWFSSFDLKKRPMRQSLSRSQFQYFDNGGLYVTSIEVLKEQKCRLGNKICVFPITELEGMQIDTPEDLKIFRAIFNGVKSLMY